MHRLFMDIIIILKYNIHNYDEIIIKILDINGEIRMQIVKNLQIYGCPQLIERLYKAEELLYRKYIPTKYIIKFYTPSTINSYFCWVIDEGNIRKALLLLESNMVTICFTCAKRLYLKTYLDKYVKNISPCTICQIYNQLKIKNMNDSDKLLNIKKK